LTNKFNAVRQTYKPPKVCKPPPPPVPPVPPVPPPPASYADCVVEWEQVEENGDGNGNGEERGNGHWRYERRIPLTNDGDFFTEPSPPPIPNVYCKLQTPYWENGVAHILIDLWGKNEEETHSMAVEGFEVDRADPCVGDCNDWDEQDDGNIEGYIIFHLVGPFFEEH